jgi:preprotein translocase subunit YajC
MIEYAWAMAPASGQPAGGGGFMDIIFLFGPLILIFYFLLIRPQQKQQKKHTEMVKSLQRGDEVVTSGGLYGTVMSAEEPEFLMIQIADKVKVKVARSSVSGKVEGEKKA